MTASEVAKYFLNKQYGEESEITHMKLHKLLYYSQGVYLALNDKPLFEDEIRKWPLGPVVPNVYHEYKEYKALPIPAPKDVDFDGEDNGDLSLLDEVYDVFGQFSAWRLSEMTHQEDPWMNAQSEAVITHRALKEYFIKKVNRKAE